MIGGNAPCYLKKMDIVSSRKDGLRVIYEVKQDEIFQILSLLEGLITKQMEETMAILGGLKQKSRTFKSLYTVFSSLY